jgi:5-methylcytosine-specific restriction endonuclease McrA
MPYKDPEKRKEYERSRRKEKREYDKLYNKSPKGKARYKRYRETHTEQLKIYAEAYEPGYQEIRTIARKEREKQKTAQEKEQDKLKQRLYRQTHPEQKRKDRRVRRALKALVKEHYTIQDELFTLILFGHQCFNCGSKENLTIDHNYPLSKGYALTRSNACVLCFSCNSQKHDHFPEKFYLPEKLQELFTLLGIIYPPIPYRSAFTEACDSLTCSCL